MSKGGSRKELCYVKLCEGKEFLVGKKEKDVHT